MTSNLSLRSLHFLVTSVVVWRCRLHPNVLAAMAFFGRVGVISWALQQHWHVHLSTLNRHNGVSQNPWGPSYFASGGFVTVAERVPLVLVGSTRLARA
jgi:hypothetical protein